jgi:hypothetical protein
MIDMIWNFRIVRGAARLGSEAGNGKKNSKVKASHSSKPEVIT